MVQDNRVFAFKLRQVDALFELVCACTLLSIAVVKVDRGDPVFGAFDSSSTSVPSRELRNGDLSGADDTVSRLVRVYARA